MTRAQANAEAWRRMVEAFPPPPKPEVPGAGQDDAPAEVAEMLDRLDDAPPDLVRDTLWAYEHLEHKGVKPDSAPSRGACSLLTWARDYRNRFFEAFLPKAMAAKGKDEFEHENIQTDRNNMQQIRQVLTRFVETSKPADLKEAAASFATQWCDTHRLKLTPEAREDLEAGISDLVLSRLTLHR
jgi:hypothetical protein